MSSGTNFLLTVLVARNVGADEFGAFSVGMSVYLLCLTLSRSSISETMILGIGRARGLVHTELAAALSATMLLAGAEAAVILLGAALVTNGDLAVILLVLAVGLPGLLLQDYKRMAFFARGEPKRAFASDCLWAVLQLTGIVTAGVLGIHSPAVLLAIWASSALLSGWLWPAVTRGWWRQSGLAWLRRERALILPLGGDGLLFQLGNQVSVFLLGAVAGLSQAGGYRGAQALFGPVTVLLLGLRTGLLPELMKMRRRSLKRALRAATLLTVAAGVFTGVCGIALILLPDSIGKQVLGPTWITAASLLGLVAIDRTCNTVGWGSGIQLRILFRPRLSFLVRVFATASSVVVAVVGASLGGAYAVALGTAIMSPLLAICSLLAVRHARRTASDADGSDGGVETTPAVPDTAVGRGPGD